MGYRARIGRAKRGTDGVDSPPQPWAPTFTLPTSYRLKTFLLCLLNTQRFCLVIISEITQHSDHAHVFLVSDVTSVAAMIESVHEHVCGSYANASF